MLGRLLWLFKAYLPYGVLEPWDDVDPKLYHALHIYWLKFYGLWFIDFRPGQVWFWLRVGYALIVLTLVCFIPGLMEAVYMTRRADNIANIAEGLYLFLSEMYTYFKLAVFWWNKKKILGLLQYLRRPEFRPRRPAHRRILRESVESARFVMTAYCIMCVCAVSVAILMPMTENFTVLPTNVEMPFINVYQSPWYEILYLHHIYYKPATCIIDGVMDTILAAFVASAIGQLEILSYNLRNFDQSSKESLVDKKNGIECAIKRNRIKYVLKDCIKHHNSIIRYVAMVESSFSLASMLQFMLSAMVLCLVALQFLSIDAPAQHPLQITWMLVYLTCMLVECYILCWFGNELIWKSEALRQAVFEGPWTTLDPGSSRIVVVFMERCKRPLKVTAGKIFTLSLDTYIVLINWSYKAFAVMNSMKN